LGAVTHIPTSPTLKVAGSGNLLKSPSGGYLGTATTGAVVTANSSSTTDHGSSSGAPGLAGLSADLSVPRVDSKAFGDASSLAVNASQSPTHGGGPYGYPNHVNIQSMASIASTTITTDSNGEEIVITEKEEAIPHYHLDDG